MQSGKKITSGIILFSHTAEVKKQSNKKMYLEENQKKILHFLSLKVVRQLQ